ncbi:syntaxin-2-like [Pollicipes pollicipes]|uniref:syntaxin-2-like n=1 Tax=Pollicipes pollicipes TaxID=41117 RepID=UPI0018851CBA|nr:syntaxin-2-like [Pollicipes pollicipes]
MEQAWQATQQRATAALARLSRLRLQLDGLQQKLNDKTSDLTSTQAHMVQIQINSARRQLLSVVQHFNDEELNFRARKKEHLKRQLLITGAAIDDEELETLLDNGDVQLFNESIMMRVETARAELNEAEDRYQQIRALETSIEQLHEMFIQLSLLVQQQGEAIDRIEDNTMKTVANAERGQKELGSALQKKKNSRKMMIGCGIVLAVVGVILLIILISYLG